MMLSVLQKKLQQLQQQQQRPNHIGEAEEEAFLQEAAKQAQEERKLAELKLIEAEAHKPSEADQKLLLEHRQDLLLRISSRVSILRFLLRHGVDSCSLGRAAGCLGAGS